LDVATTRLIESLILPPGGLLFLALLGLLFWRHAFGRRLLGLSLVLLLLLSLPVTSELLYASLETEPALSPARLAAQRPQAIVVLSGGRNLDAPEYAGDTLSTRTLGRLRYAAKLARETGLPVIPSGGNPGAVGVPEAVLAQDLLTREFGVSVSAIERRSNTTWENARYTAQLMKQLEIERALLVTDAGHMKRALYAFERNGLHPTPAPMNFRSIASSTVSPGERVLPSAVALKESRDALHEMLGLVWYRLK
jgi:uncharacterized SAM-binding protein YcdF (DUF218 family)